MPRAVADLTQTERLDLATLPGGFVELRKMLYGELLHRRDIASTMKARKGSKGNRDVSFEFDTDELNVQHYEFRTCIVEHNLEDENDKPLDFNRKEHVAKLDPKIAGEIEKKIMEMNFPDDDLDDESDSKSRLQTTASESDPVQSGT